MPSILYFEDLRPGDTFESDFRTVGAEEIVAFARQYDPQPFHTGEPPLIEPLYEGLIAPGWHTGAICMRQMSDALLLRCAVYCSPGVGDIRWLAPLRPGMSVMTRIVVKEKGASRRDHSRGRISFDVRLIDSASNVLMSMQPTVLFARRLRALSPPPPGG